MNYGELQTLIAQYFHRTDLGAFIPGFIERARERINERYGSALASFIGDPAGNNATNEVLTEAPNLYLFASLSFGSEFENNGDNAASWGQAWEELANRKNVSGPKIEAINPYDDDNPLCITPIQYIERA